MEDVRRQATITQISRLLDFMASHEELALGYLHRSKEGRQVSSNLWEEIAAELNLVGPSRTSKQWTKYWSDYKSRVRAKLRDVRKYASGTGGGPYVAPNLSPFEEKVVQIIGANCVDPLEGVRPDVLSVPEDSVNSIDDIMNQSSDILYVEDLTEIAEEVEYVDASDTIDTLIASSSSEGFSTRTSVPPSAYIRSSAASTPEPSGIPSVGSGTGPSASSRPSDRPAASPPASLRPLLRPAASTPASLRPSATPTAGPSAAGRPSARPAAGSSASARPSARLTAGPTAREVGSSAVRPLRARSLPGQRARSRINQRVTTRSALERSTDLITSIEERRVEAELMQAEAALRHADAMLIMSNAIQVFVTAFSEQQSSRRTDESDTAP